MYLHHIFRSLIPLRNPLGFGASDLLALGLAMFALIAIFGQAYFAPAFRLLAQRTAWCMAVLFLLPIGLRTALLARAPVPSPTTSQDFSSILLADTLLHGRLQNPPHRFPQFFEAPLVIQRPVYRSTLPLWDGLLPAMGKLLFRNYWSGILLGIGGVSALSYWAFRGWISAEWALCGGIMTAFALGPLCRWTNGYWGGFILAWALCALFGAIPRILPRRPARLHFGTAILAFTCFLYTAHFFFWYAMYGLADQSSLRAVLRYAGQDFLTSPEGQVHRFIQQELQRAANQQLVFVRRDQFASAGQWIHNSADIDESKVVWAHDLGEDKNQELLGSYPNRQVWLFEPDAIPPRLRPYLIRSALTGAQAVR